MMTTDQMEQIISDIRQDMAAQKEKLSSAHKRIDENDALTARIHDLAASIETLALQVKIQNDRMEKWLDAVEARMKAQGERIGALEMKPAKRWEVIAAQLITIAVAAAAGIVLAKFGL